MAPGEESTSTGLHNLQEGDLVRFRESTRQGWWKYRHWAVYIGNGVIVHVQKGDDGHVVTMETIEVYMRRANRKCCLRRHSPKPTTQPASKVVEIAVSCIGMKYKYHPIFNNCEHFAKWCKYGERSSWQVDLGMALWGTSVGALAGGLTVIGVGVGVGCGSVAVLATGGLAAGIIVIAGVSTLAWTAHKLHQQEKELRNLDCCGS